MAALLFFSFALSALAVVVYPTIWTSEQFALVSGNDWSRSTWAIVVAGHAGAILLVSLLGNALAKHNRRYRSIYQTWSLAAVFMLCLLPIRLAGLTEALSAAALQVACLAVYLTGLSVWRRRSTRAATSARGPYWPGFLFAGLLLWPWVIWGGFGSWLDTILNLAVASLFGWAFGRTIEVYLLTGLDETGGHPRATIALGGLAVATMLTGMGPALGVNGQQLILLFLLPAAGWLAIVSAFWRRDDQLATGWRTAGLFIGLLTAGPLLFIDPDELVLVLNIGTRDVGAYALYATLIGSLSALVVGFLLWLASGSASKPSKKWVGIFASIIWAGLIAVYLFMGQPGWHGERLFVIMAEQPDLSLAGRIADPVERRTFVYQNAVELADASQSNLREILDSLRISYRPYYLVNAVEVDAGPLIKLWLERRADVDRVLISPELRPLPQPIPVARGTEPGPSEAQWNLTSIGAPEVWETFGATGEGIIVGQSDSGVDGVHPELREQYRGNQPGEFSGDEYNWLDPWNGSTSPVDLGGHGTHTLGSVLGSSVGVAPQATWIGCVNLARNLANPPYYLNCLQFLFAPFSQNGDPLRDSRPELGAHILNNSWGCPALEGCDSTVMQAAVEALREGGVFVVASAGNEGDTCGSIADPIALYDAVFTVGAIDETGLVAPFSSRGPVTADGSNRIKPDLVAPGVDILSAFPGESYEFSSGTSMAGPHVAGVVALMWSANGALIGRIEETERILVETARPYDHTTHGVPACGDANQQPDNATGYGLVDAFAAVAAAVEY